MAGFRVGVAVAGLGFWVAVAVVVADEVDVGEVVAVSVGKTSPATVGAAVGISIWTLVGGMAVGWAVGAMVVGV